MAASKPLAVDAAEASQDHHVDYYENVQHGAPGKPVLAHPRQVNDPIDDGVAGHRADGAGGGEKGLKCLLVHSQAGTSSVQMGKISSCTTQDQQRSSQPEGPKTWIKMSKMLTSPKTTPRAIAVLGGLGPIFGRVSKTRL